MAMQRSGGAVAVGQVYTCWPKDAPLWQVMAIEQRGVVVRRLQGQEGWYTWPIETLERMILMAP